jgi:hypothetical protein
VQAIIAIYEREDHTQFQQEVLDLARDIGFEAFSKLLLSNARYIPD